jgi:hypothetical protein
MSSFSGSLRLGLSAGDVGLLDGPRTRDRTPLPTVAHQPQRCRVLAHESATVHQEDDCGKGDSEARQNDVEAQ